MATDRIARAARARGETVAVVSTVRNVAPGGRSHATRDEIETFGIGHLDDPERDLAALVDHTVDIARSTGATLLHGIYATRAGYAATLAAARCALPCVVSIRGNDLHRGLYHPRDHAWLSHAMTRATVVTAVSSELAHTAAGTFGRPVHVVGNSVDCERFAPRTPDNSLKASLGLQDEAVLGYSGELREKKGMRFLLPAFARICEHRPARLLLIGGVRSDAAEAFEEFGRLAPAARERIVVLDYVRSPKRLCDLLALCDLMLFPSLTEGMPNAVLEAMAAARPILATAVGGHLDLIRHGETGALLDPSELDRLPEAIEEMLDLPEDERRGLGTAARQYVERCHRPEDESAAWNEVYAEARAAGVCAPEIRRVFPTAD